MNNWKAIITGIGAALTSALAGIAALPYTLGDVALWIPADYKAQVAVASIFATVALRFLQSLATRKTPTT